MRFGLTALALAAAACSADRVTYSDNGLRTPPPMLFPTATTREVTVGSAHTLEVLVSLYNPTAVHLKVRTGAQCPVFVQLIPHPAPDDQGSLDASMACAFQGSVIDVAPRDSVLLTRVLDADSLNALPPDRYGVNVAVTTSDYVIGTWAGTVELPLSSSP